MTSLIMFHLISFSPHFIDHVLSHFLQSTPHCSCFILFPSVYTSLFMFHLISFSPHLTVHVSSYFHQSTLHCSCFIIISFSPQSISFISSTTVLLVHIYLIWLYLYYMVIQPHCKFHFLANQVLEFNDLRVSLDKFLILDRYSLLEAELRWF